MLIQEYEFKGMHNIGKHFYTKENLILYTLNKLVLVHEYDNVSKSVVGFRIE